jgi:hypothetical protein
MTLRFRIQRTRAYYQWRRFFSKERGGLWAQRGHCNHRKLTERG